MLQTEVHKQLGSQSPGLGWAAGSARSVAAAAAGSVRSAPAANGSRDLVLMHVPFNFGHTAENVAMFGSDPASVVNMNKYIYELGGYGDITQPATWEEANLLTKEGGSVWGHLNPDLQLTSNITGCPMYYTPQKYWPQKLAEQYFGNATIFGMLRDPYERLVAYFRGNIEGYGGSFPEYFQTCDVNAAVKSMLQSYLAGDKYANGCTMLPQAEFYEGPYGIQLAVDNRNFPQSMNDVFLEHGYPDYQIQTHDVLHVSGCDEIWAGDLEPDTRALVKQIYAADFDLLCKNFGYCDNEENCCLWQVPGMCPTRVMEQGYHGVALDQAV